MKQTTSVSIGRSNFILDEDAYEVLGMYLENYRKDLDRKESRTSASEILEEVEMRIADLFRERLGGREVVDEAMVRSVIGQLGLPDGEDPQPEKAGKTAGAGARSGGGSGSGSGCGEPIYAKHKLYRDYDGKKIGGVCAGLSEYFEIDVTLIRVLFVLAFIFASTGFWIYVIFWIVLPEARTAVEKCELRGIPATAENIEKFSR